MNIVLIGYRGSGKTTVGQLLAARLGWPFVDADEWIVSQAGLNIRQIFQQHGEGRFRQMETQALRELMLRDEHIVSLGGGAVLSEENRRIIIESRHLVLYLSGDPEELHRRISSDPATADNRPALTGLGGGIEEIRHLLSQRDPWYREVMTAQIDVTRKIPTEVADEITTLLTINNHQPPTNNPRRTTDN